MHVSSILSINMLGHLASHRLPKDMFDTDNTAIVQFYCAPEAMESAIRGTYVRTSFRPRPDHHPWHLYTYIP
jgi:hypothetical protein